MKRVLRVVEEETLDQKFEEFIQDRKINGCCDKTIHSYRSHMRALRLDMTISFNKVDWNEIILDIRAKDISETSKNTYLRTLKVFMKWLGIEDLPKIKKVETVKDIYTEDELRRLIAKPKAGCSWAEFRTWVIILLIMDTGMRSSSIRSILIKDLDLENRLVYLRHTKNRKISILPFSSTTQNALKRLLDARRRTEPYQPDDYLFCSVYSSKFSENGLAEAIKQYNNKRGITKTSVHLFRHCFVRELVIAGQSPFIIQQTLGHSDLTMTKHYCRLYSTDLIDCYKSPVEMLERHQIRLQDAHGAK